MKRPETVLNELFHENDVWLDAETKVYEAPADHSDELRLWLRLLTCTTLMETEIRRRLRDSFDTTLPRFDLLAQLEKSENGLVLGDLSRRMMVSAGNLTALVERMVASGHVSRTPLPSDRRVQIIALTEFGRNEFRKMADEHAEWISELFGSMSAEECSDLTKRLGVLKKSILSSLVDRR